MSEAVIPYNFKSNLRDYYILILKWLQFEFKMDVVIY